MYSVKSNVYESILYKGTIVSKESNKYILDEFIGLIRLGTKRPDSLETSLNFVDDNTRSNFSPFKKIFRLLFADEDE